MAEWKKRLARAILQRVRILAEYEPNGLVCMTYTAFLSDMASRISDD